MNNENVNPGTINQPDVSLGDVLAAIEGVRAAIEVIEIHLIYRYAALINTQSAAAYLGITIDEFCALVRETPTLRPVAVIPGRSGWRRADLDAFLQSLRPDGPKPRDYSPGLN